jgi:hypothetical protein
LKSLRAAPGNAWFGHVKCALAGEPDATYFAVIHHLADCAMALLYCGETKVGPGEIVVVVPGGLRARLRPEFAFEFLAFACFLGAIAEADAHVLQERIGAAIAEAEAADSLVFSLGNVGDPLLSQCVETVALAMELWLG